MQANDQKSIVLFDGICNLCNASVQFILKKDREEQFLFASLQSDAAKKILLHYKEKKIGDSIVLIQNGQVYQKSVAVLKISKHLKWPWNMFSVAEYLPESLNNKFYDLVAKHRYKWFGRKDQCIMMIPEYKNRFI